MSVAVAGVGESGPTLEDPRSIPEIVLESVEAALADAGLGHDDVDAVVTASVDLLDGLTASNIAVTEVVGAVLKPETRIAADGLLAAIHAACLVRAGAYETVLVVAHGKSSLAPYWSLTSWALDPVALQPLGADFLVCAALQARAVAADDVDSAAARWASLVAERRRAAGERGIAPACSAEEALASPVVADPLRQGLCAPLADGATAVVLRAAGPDDAVRIGGVGFDLDAHGPGDRELTDWSGLRRAWARALAAHGGPPPAIDVAEPSCVFPHEEELFRRALELNDGVLVSPRGGLQAGFVPVTAGLSRLVAAVEQLRLGAGRTAVAHGTWGPAGQGQAVAILEAAA